MEIASLVIASLVHSPLARALGWTLFHSLWEGALVAMVLFIALSVTRSSRTRYASACLAMLAILASFAYTFFLVKPESSNELTTVFRYLNPASPGGHNAPALPPPARLPDALAWLTPFWIAGVILFHLRTTASWIGARRLRRNGVCLPPDGWQQRLNHLATRMRLTRPVSMLESCFAEAPVVMGWLRPVILVPIGLLAGMPASQLETILLHELAHIRRRDYLANLLQMVVEGFLFYHPAIWWISSVIRTERENCCDDLVVATHGNAHEYATALTVLEENRRNANHAALAATGGVLMKRIHRLLYPRETPRTFPAPVFAAGLLTIVAALALTAWQSRPATESERIADAFNRWLNVDVRYIITPQERSAFNALQSNEERQMFVEQFWTRRNPTPGAAENPFQVEHYRRMAYANDHFASRADTPGWKTDRGRIYITFGPPDEIDSHPVASAAKPPYEAWRYRWIEGIGNNVNMEFVDAALDGEFHMTMDPNPQGATRRITRP